MTELEVALDARVAQLEALLAAERAAAAAKIAALTQERDRLRASHERLRLELEMLKRRIFVAKAERVDTTQLELEFADKLRQLDVLAGTLAKTEEGGEADDLTSPTPGSSHEEPRRRPTGRRDLKKLRKPSVRDVAMAG